MKTIKTIFAIIAIALFSVGVSLATGLNPMLAFGGATALSFIKSPSTAAAYAGLNKEIWLDTLLEGFYADDMFISECVDMSAWVENDVINLAEAGVNPNVLINNTTYPIATAERADGAIVLPLDRFDSENTALKHADRVELAYDKLASIVYGHRQALRMTFMEKAAHAIAPTSNSTDTPVLQATGADNGSGKKRMKYSDILRLKKAFDNAEIPAEGRILVLTAQHQEDLEVEDVDRFNRVLERGVLAGFKLYFLAEKRLPFYILATGVKAAFASTFVGATHSRASIAFQKNEVMRAKGDPTMFWGKAEDDPTNRQDVVGFAHRGLVLPLRNKGIAAIYSPAV